VLIPAPYYAAFDVDLKIIAGCVAVPVHCSEDPSRGPSPQDLEAAARFAEEKGLRVRMLLITNPCNPIGTIYDPEVMKDAIEWARARDMHTIVDELYALSTHPGFQFESILTTLNNELGDDVHHIWALSKDFGASGFRMGTLYTQNEKLLKSVANLNIFSGVSHPMQMIVSEVLLDDAWVYDFLQQARERIRYSYEICTRMLDEMVVPYYPASAGIFVYADFSSLLPEPTAAGEAKFASLLLDAARIIMTPGQAQHDQKPGMFRICYCFVSPELLTMAMQRLDNIIVKIRTRRIHWENLTPESYTDIII
jgi:aspartate/methionine/tyrosine aminotransferase